MNSTTEESSQIGSGGRTEANQGMEEVSTSNAEGEYVGMHYKSHLNDDAISGSSAIPVLEGKVLLLDSSMLHH